MQVLGSFFTGHYAPSGRGRLCHGSPPRGRSQELADGALDVTQGTTAATDLTHKAGRRKGPGPAGNHCRPAPAEALLVQLAAELVSVSMPRRGIQEDENSPGRYRDTHACRGYFQSSSVFNEHRTDTNYKLQVASSQNL